MIYIYAFGNITVAGGESPPVFGSKDPMLYRPRRKIDQTTGNEAQKG
jgi:hypothetical protein